MRWTPEADTALQELKAYMSSVPTLVAPKPQESLLLYLAATNQVVSAALVAHREVDEAESEQRPAESEKDHNSDEHVNESNPKDAARKKVVQRPVYFASSLLQGARSRYSGVHKLIFRIIMASRKLRHYFQPMRSQLLLVFRCKGYSETLRLLAE